MDSQSDFKLSCKSNDLEFLENKKINATPYLIVHDIYCLSYITILKANYLSEPVGMRVLGIIIIESAPQIPFFILL